MKWIARKKLLIVLAALIVGAFSQMAAGQTTITCPDCTHVVSYYKGDGGLIATAADGADSVSWLAKCGGLIRAGELEPNSNRLVSTLFSGNTACEMDGGEFEIGPIKDGGWFWITDDNNSAVGNLVDKSILENATTEIANAGRGVSMSMGSGAVFLKEMATGRVGILPNILPEMEMEPEEVRKCGYSGAGTASSPYARVVSECEMGDGRARILATYTHTITNVTTRVMDGDAVVRPAGVGSISMVIDLWGNDSGHFTTDATASSAADPVPAGANFLRGHSGAPAALREQARYANVDFNATRGSAVGSPTELADGTEAAGLTFNGATAGVGTLMIARDTAYCSSDNNYTVTVSVTATITDATARAQVTPSIVVNDDDEAAKLTFRVVCPRASANRGEELVPENPFPTNE